MGMDSNPTRRDFLKLAAAATAFAFGGGTRIANAKPEEGGAAELMITNGRFATMNPGKQAASAVAIKDGRFVAVGTEAEIMAHRGNRTRVIDVKGRRVIPGLNDSHIHVIRGGLNYSMELRWDGVPSLADALSMLRQQARRTPPPQWVRVVGGWSEFQFRERRRGVAGRP